MAQYEFGSGDLFAIVEGANRTPRKFGVLQEGSLEISFDLKKLHGQDKFPVAVAQGKGSVMLKAKAAEIYGALWAEVVFGDVALTAGQRMPIIREAGVVPTTPFTITVANGATFYEDLGVVNAATGIALTRVASAPTAGQYSVNTTSGVYTFASADTAMAVLISYSHTPASGGKRFTVANQKMGRQTFFRAVLALEFDSDPFYVALPRCVAGKLSVPFKNEDFTIFDFEAEALADAAGNIIEFGVSDQ